MVLARRKEGEREDTSEHEQFVHEDVRAGEAHARQAPEGMYAIRNRDSGVRDTYPVVRLLDLEGAKHLIDLMICQLSQPHNNRGVCFEHAPCA
jgi:hypothetical protein